VKKSVVTTSARSSSNFQTAASSGPSNPTSKSGFSPGLKIFETGRRTCVSVSAFSFDAQPAQLERLVKRICLPDG
jgi:hypothetical protein